MNDTPPTLKNWGYYVTGMEGGNKYRFRVQAFLLQTPPRIDIALIMYFTITLGRDVFTNRYVYWLHFFRYLDWMNILSYDYHSAFEPAVNHHAPLYPLEEDNEYNYDAELTIVST